MHLIFCARFIIFFSFLRGVELKTFFPSTMLRGCLVCVICNSNSIHSFIFKLCTMIVHILKMCTSYFVHVLLVFFLFLTGVEPRHFFHRQCLGGAKYVICNSNSIHSFIFKLCIMIVHTEDVHLLYCTRFINFFSFLTGVELRHFSI